jgi:hypothetical protein
MAPHGLESLVLRVAAGGKPPFVGREPMRGRPVVAKSEWTRARECSRLPQNPCKQVKSVYSHAPA